MKINCEYCTGMFEKPSCWIHRVKRNFCSKSCADNFRKGKTYFEQYGFDRAIVALAKLCISMDGEKNPNYGNGKKISGEKNPNWLGGKSKEKYPKEYSRKLREIVRTIYGFRCVMCGIEQDKLGRKLDVHHIDYDKNNNKEENLVCLCKTCHTLTNFKREFWINYFNK